MPDYPPESKILFPDDNIMTIEEELMYDDTLSGYLIYGFKERETFQNWRWDADNYQLPNPLPPDIGDFRSATDELFDIITTNEARYSEEMQLELPRSEHEFVATNAYFLDKIHRTLSRFIEMPSNALLHL